MVIYLAGLATVPVGIEEAAALDGAGTCGPVPARHAARYPPADRDRDHARPRPRAAGLRPDHGAHRWWPGGATETLATQVYKQSFALGNFGFGAALALVLTVIILFFAVIQQRLTQRAQGGLRCSATRRRPGIREGIVWVLALVFLLPFYFLVITALKTDAGGAVDERARHRRLPTSTNFVEVVTATGNSNMIMGLSTACSSPSGIMVLLVLLGSLAGYVISRRTAGRLSRARTTCSLSRSSCRRSSAPSLSISARARIGLTGSMWGMIILFTGMLLPLSVFLYAGFFRGLATDYEEAAPIDGASRTQIFFRIVLPLMAPATGTVAILAGLIVWNDFFTSLIFLGGSANQTLPVAMYYYVGSLVSAWNMIFAIVIVSMIPILAFYLFAQKRFIQGFAGGLKG